MFNFKAIDFLPRRRIRIRRAKNAAELSSLVTYEMPIKE